MQKMILLPNSTRPTFIEKFFTFKITYHNNNLFEILYSSPNSFCKNKYIAIRVTSKGKILDCLKDNK